MHLLSLLPFLSLPSLLLVSLALPAEPLPIIPRACAATKASSSKYPEKYNDYKGFDFGGVSGPYYEFPIEESGILVMRALHCTIWSLMLIYAKGSPGADGIIFNTGGTLAGETTHTGASNNAFVGCIGSS
jgi:hypothetical protein